MTHGTALAARAPSTRPSPLLRLLTGGTEVAVGFGGIIGGATMVANPSGIPGIEPAMLARTPFDSLTGPGLLVLVLNGVVPLCLGLLLMFSWRPAAPLSAAYGLGLAAWIITQLVLLEAPVFWLQPVMLALGLAIAAGSWSLQRASSSRRHD